MSSFFCLTATTNGAPSSCLSFSSGLSSVLLVSLLLLIVAPSHVTGLQSPQTAEYLSRAEIAAGNSFRIPLSTNPQYGQRCEAFRGPDPFWTSPPVGSHQYWQLSVAPQRTYPPLSDLRSYSTVGMYEAIPAVPLFPPADGLAGVGKVRAPVLQPTPWLQLRRETTSVPIKQIDKFPQVAKAADAVIMWCIHEALKRVQTGNENSAGLTGAVQILRQSVDLREHIRKKQEEALASFNALIETASKEFSGVDIRLFRFWGMAANLKGQPNEPDDMYVESMEQTRWLLSNALLRATGQLSGETVDSKLVDCEHLTYTAYSSKLRKIFTLKESKTRFCSISVTGWILFGARQLFDIAKSASESGDGEATATLVSIQEAIKKFEGVKEDLEQLWPVFEEYRSTVLSWLPKPETTAEAEK